MPAQLISQGVGSPASSNDRAENGRHNKHPDQELRPPWFFNIDLWQSHTLPPTVIKFPVRALALLLAGWGGSGLATLHYGDREEIDEDEDRQGRWNEQYC